MSQILEDVDLILQARLLWRSDARFLHDLDGADLICHFVCAPHDFAISTYRDYETGVKILVA